MTNQTTLSSEASKLIAELGVEPIEVLHKLARDYTGQKYGTLTVLCPVRYRDKKRYMFWLVQCDCGNYLMRRSDHLKEKRVYRCNVCLPLRSDHPIYNSWKSLRQRCNDKNGASYARYGGRGIKVCKRWDSWNNFRDDMYPTFKKGLSLDRIDNNKGYSPENCRWATQEEQHNNTRKNRYITYKGVKKSVAQWSRATGIKPITILNRLNSGMVVERVLSKKSLCKKNI